MDLQELEALAASCDFCGLHKGRKKPVFAKGNSKAKIVVCGMVPAKNENVVGTPFVGRAGKLLDSMLEDAGLAYGEVYITNLVKCFLAAGKPLNKSWVKKCLPYFMAQVYLMQPKVILTLGKDASFALIDKTKGSLGSVRGKVIDVDGIPVIPTYHPSYLLRKGGKKAKDYKVALEDIKLAIELSN